MQHLGIVHVFPLQHMRLGKSTDRLMQILTVFDVDHHRQESLLHIFYL